MKKQISKKIGLNTKQRKLSPKFALYFDTLISSISPLVTLDEQYNIRFANRSFIEIFYRKKKKIETQNIFKIISLKSPDRKYFLENLEKSRSLTIQNCEFKNGRKTFGYSLFRFADEIGIILKDITHIKKLEQKVTRLHSDLLKVQEKERQRLAAELHDGVGQTILAAKLNLISFMNGMEQNHERFNTGIRLIDQASQELRDIYTDLYPSVLKDLGLEAGIRSMSRNILDVQSIKTDLNIEIKSRLSDETEVNLFRIIQELFSNIARHSGATRVSLGLRTSRNQIVRMILKENGIGFSPESVRMKSVGFGIENIRRRVEDCNGIMRIDSDKRKGVVIEVELPFSLKPR